MRSISIKRYLGQIILFVAVFSVLFMAIFKLYWFDPRIQQETKQRQLQVAYVLSHQVKIYLATPLIQLESVTALASKPGARDDIFEQALDAQVNVSDALEVAYALDAGGKVKAIGLPSHQQYRRRDLQNLDLSQNPLYQSARQAGKLVWSDAFLSMVNEELSIGFAIPTPKWVFMGEVSLDKLRAHLQQIAGNTQSLVLVLDSRGQVVFDQQNKYSNQQMNISNIPAVHEVLQSRKTIARQFYFDDQDMQGVLTPIEGSSWYVIYAEPSRIAFATSHALAVASTIFFLLTVLVAVSLTVMLSKKVTSQFTDLADRAQRVAAGETHVSWPDFLVLEFAQLAHSIQHTTNLLLERERQLRTLMGNLPGMVYRARNDGVSETGFLSEGCLKLTGYTSEDLQGENLSGFRRLIGREDVARHDQSMRQFIDAKRPWQLVYKIVTRDGLIKWVCDYGREIIDASNGVAYREGFIVDITEQKKSENDLAESEARLRAVLSNLPVILTVVDRGGIFTLCEGKGLSNFRMHPHALLGTSFLDRYKNFPQIKEDFQRCLQGESVHSQIRIYEAWYDIYYEPILDANQQVARVMVLSIDMTGRKNAENKMLRLSSLLRGAQSLAHVGGWELDVASKTLYWSSETYRIYGVSPEEFTPTLDKAMAFMRPESRAKFATAIQLAMDEGIVYDMHLTLLTGDGRQREVHASCEVIRENNQTIRIIGAVQDVTAYKQIENELRSHKLHLQDLVEQRTLELVLARDAAEKATRSKSDFLANTSHEIRTPINAVMGFTRLALNTELLPVQRSYLEKIHTSASLLLGLINDILDFSKIEAGYLDLSMVEFSLTDVLKQVSTVTAQRAHEKNIEYLLHIDPSIAPILIGDPMRLSQILINLCGNAVKFTEKGEVILSVTVSSSARQQLTLQFSVQDSGIGLAPSEIELLFQPFKQVDSSHTRRYGGTGLGLAISRQLVEMMGGRIWVESSPGVGSEFVFTASFDVGEPPPPVLAYQVQPGLKQKALLVDASAKASEIHAALLESLGFDTVKTGSLPEAQRVLSQPDQAAIDIVLVDGKLLSGQESSCQAFKTALVTHPARVIVMTNGVSKDAESDSPIRADAWVTKPLMASSLSQAIADVLCQSAPPAARPDSYPALAAKARHLLKGRQVLLVEDNDFNQEVASEMLQDLGIDVTLACNGSEAIDCALAQHFDLVLMDIQMPVMGGLAATRSLRREARLLDLPIIAMTAHTMVDEQRNCISAGMNDFIGKPFDPDILLNMLLKWIKAPPVSVSPDAASHPVSGMPAHFPDTVAGISVADGLRYSGGKAEFYLKMLRRFLQTKSAIVTDIQTQMDCGEWDSACRIAHTSKSIAAHIGANDLAEVLSALEQALREKNSKAVETHLTTCANLLAIVMQGLQSALGDAPISTPVAAGFALDITEYLRQLEDVLPRDIGKALRLERKIRPSLEAGPLAHEYEKFRQHLRSFDTHAAIEALRTVMDAYAAKVDMA